MGPPGTYGTFPIMTDKVRVHTAGPRGKITVRIQSDLSDQLVEENLTPMEAEQLAYKLLNESREMR